MFIDDQTFNYNNFMSSIQFLNVVYEIYNTSLTSPISLDYVESAINTLGLENAVLFETFASPFRSPSVPFGSIQSIIAIGGIIKNTNIAVIAFRGTSNNTEWINDFQSMNLISLPDISTDKNVGTLESLSGIPMTMPYIKIGDGFLRIYASRIGYRSSTNCVCKTNCNNGFCPTFSSLQYSQIVGSCQSSKTSCDSISGPSLQSQIYQFLSKMKCSKVIITGHSLGSALANICAFHLKNAFQNDFIHSVYSFAPPRTGNPDFANNILSIQNRFYTIINSNDMITNIPLPFMSQYLGCFTHVGKLLVFTQIDSTIECNLDYVWTMHRLDTYQNNFQTLYNEYVKSTDTTSNHNFFYNYSNIYSNEYR